MPLVSIIIVNWNGAEDTCACLNSLKMVDYPNFSVHVVDNASDDDSVKIISEKHPWVKLHQSERNLYFAGGNNFGWRFARKEKPAYLLFLNNDTEVRADFLTPLVKVMETDSGIGVSGPKIYHYDQPDLIWSAGGKINFFRGEMAHYGLREKDNEKWNTQRDVDYLTGCAQMIRADLLELLNGYDESYGMYSEDADLCFRASRMGYRIVYVPDSVIWHKISSSSGGGLTTYKIKRKILSNYKFFRKYAHFYHWIAIPLFVFWGILKFFISSVFKGKFRQAGALMGGIAGLFKSEGKSKNDNK